jgi:predicted acyl esterase
MRRTAASVITILMIAAGVSALGSSATAAAVPAGATWSEIYLPSRDGTMLHGDLLLPTDGCPQGGCPVIVSIGPYYGSGSQTSLVVPFYDPMNEGPSNRFHDFIAHDFPGRGNIFQQGYAWLQVDSRGYGGSDGCNDYGGIGEQMDAASAVEWAGAQSWSNGKVGMWGKSYDGWTQVMALAQNPPHLEAVVIQSPLIEGYGIGYVNGVHHDPIWYATTSLYMLYDYIPPSVTEITPEEAVYPVKGTATDPCWVSQQAIIAAGWDHDLEYWRERDIRASARRNDDVAVLWSHGFNDINTKPDQIFGVYDNLNKMPKSNHRAWFGEWAHFRGNEANETGREGFLEESMDWFDHYLKGEPFRYEVNEKNVVEVQDQEGAWRTEAQYPPTDVRDVTLPLRPGSYTDNNSQAATAGYWTFSQPLEYDLRAVHEPTLTVKADLTAPYGNLVGILYDFDPETGSAKEVNRSAYRLEVDGGTVSFRMHPRDHIFREGHQLAFHITSGHPQFLPHPTQQNITIQEASVTVRFLTYERESNLVGTVAGDTSRVVTPPIAQVSAGTIQMPLPSDEIPYPDAATREQIQPTVSTPAG